MSRNLLRRNAEAVWSSSLQSPRTSQTDQTSASAFSNLTSLDLDFETNLIYHRGEHRGYPCISFLRNEKSQVRRSEGNSGMKHFHYLLVRSSLLLWLLAAQTLNAQTQPSLLNSISLQLGYFYLVNRDDMASPMRYSGGSLPWILSYDYLGDIHRHSVQLSYRNSQLESAISSDGNHAKVKKSGGRLNTHTFTKST